MRPCQRLIKRRIKTERVTTRASCRKLDLSKPDNNEVTINCDVRSLIAPSRGSGLRHSRLQRREKWTIRTLRRFVT